jgi:hypothetical protein
MTPNKQPERLEAEPTLHTKSPMDNFETASQWQADTARNLRLLHFKFMQLRHTNDQLVAALQDLIARVGPVRGGDTIRHPRRKDPPA